MKNYFLAFDFYNKDINKFFFGIIEFDLGSSGLIDTVKNIILDNFDDIDPGHVEIKVTAFNKVD